MCLWGHGEYYWTFICGLGNTLPCCVSSYFFFQQFKYFFLWTFFFFFFYLWTWRYTIEVSSSLSGSIIFFLLISLSFFIFRRAWLTTAEAQIENSKQLSSILPIFYQILFIWPFNHQKTLRATSIAHSNFQADFGHFR